ncbi:c-type cytochrome [Roseateles sp. BYS180W]|uniref:C-type cytochrome n=1 Tax=Roseateles rivi TaxID=3299028 RepID=A0ABW7FRP4_9BURK
MSSDPSPGGGTPRPATPPSLLDPCATPLSAVPPQQEREPQDPHEKTRPIPWLAALAFLLLFAVGALYVALDTQPGASIHGDRRSSADLSPAVTAGAGGAALAPAQGAALFANQCAACHQAQGQGLSGVFPPLAGSEWVLGPPQVLAAILTYGISGSLQVKGQTYQGAMPAFGHLKDEELLALATHLRSSWGNQAAPFSMADIQAARALQRKQPFAGGAELEQLPR